MPLNTAAQNPNTRNLFPPGVTTSDRGSCSWYERPMTDNRIGDRLQVVDLGFGIYTWLGAEWGSPTLHGQYNLLAGGLTLSVGGTTPPIPYVLAQSAAPGMSVTGSTTESNVGTPILIPAGTVGPNSSLRITTQWSTNASSATSKTAKIYLAAASNGTAGSVGFQSDLINQTGLKHVFMIANRGAMNSNVRTSSLASSLGFIGTSATAIDFSVDGYLAFRGQLASAGDTLTLEAYTVEVLPF